MSFKIISNKLDTITDAITGSLSSSKVDGNLSILSNYSPTDNIFEDNLSYNRNNIKNIILRDKANRNVEVNCNPNIIDTNIHLCITTTSVQILDSNKPDAKVLYNINEAFTRDAVITDKLIILLKQNEDYNFTYKVYDYTLQILDSGKNIPIDEIFKKHNVKRDKIIGPNVYNAIYDRGTVTDIKSATLFTTKLIGLYYSYLFDFNKYKPYKLVSLNRILSNTPSNVFALDGNNNPIPRDNIGSVSDFNKFNSPILTINKQLKNIYQTEYMNGIYKVLHKKSEAESELIEVGIDCTYKANEVVEYTIGPVTQFVTIYDSLIAGIKKNDNKIFLYHQDTLVDTKTIANIITYIYKTPLNTILIGTETGSIYTYKVDSKGIYLDDELTNSFNKHSIVKIVGTPTSDTIATLNINGEVMIFDLEGKLIELINDSKYVNIEANDRDLNPDRFQLLLINQNNGMNIKTVLFTEDTQYIENSNTHINLAFSSIIIDRPYEIPKMEDYIGELDTENDIVNKINLTKFKFISRDRILFNIGEGLGLIYDINSHNIYNLDRFVIRTKAIELDHTIFLEDGMSIYVASTGIYAGNNTLHAYLRQAYNGNVFEHEEKILGVINNTYNPSKNILENYVIIKNNGNYFIRYASDIIGDSYQLLFNNSVDYIKIAQNESFYAIVGINTQYAPNNRYSIEVYYNNKSNIYNTPVRLEVLPPLDGKSADEINTSNIINMDISIVGSNLSIGSILKKGDKVAVRECIIDLNDTTNIIWDGNVMDDDTVYHLPYIGEVTTVKTDDIVIEDYFHKVNDYSSYTWKDRLNNYKVLTSKYRKVKPEDKYTYRHELRVFMMRERFAYLPPIAYDTSKFIFIQRNKIEFRNVPTEAGNEQGGGYASSPNDLVIRKILNTDNPEKFNKEFNLDRSIKLPVSLEKTNGEVVVEREVPAKYHISITIDSMYTIVLDTRTKTLVNFIIIGQGGKAGSNEGVLTTTAYKKLCSFSNVIRCDLEYNLASGVLYNDKLIKFTSNNNVSYQNIATKDLTISDSTPILTTSDVSIPKQQDIKDMFIIKNNLCVFTNNKLSIFKFIEISDVINIQNVAILNDVYDYSYNKITNRLFILTNNEIREYDLQSGLFLFNTIELPSLFQTLGLNITNITSHISDQMIFMRDAGITNKLEIVCYDTDKRKIVHKLDLSTIVPASEQPPDYQGSDYVDPNINVKDLNMINNELLAITDSLNNILIYNINNGKFSKLDYEGELRHRRILPLMNFDGFVTYGYGIDICTNLSMKETNSLKVMKIKHDKVDSLNRGNKGLYVKSVIQLNRSTLFVIYESGISQIIDIPYK